MDHKVSKDMISSGMIPSGEKTQADLGRTQYGSAPSPSSLMEAYRSIYEHHQKDKDGNTIPHQEDLNEGKIPAGLQAYLDKKKGKKEDKKEVKEENVDESILGMAARGANMARRASLAASKAAARGTSALRAADARAKAAGGLGKMAARTKVGQAVVKTGQNIKKTVGAPGFKGALAGGAIGGAVGAGLMSGGKKEEKPSGIVKPKNVKGFSTYDLNFDYTPEGDVISEDLFDALKSALIEEGCDEKNAMKIMASVTPDYFNEIIEEENLDEVVFTGSAMLAGLAAKKLLGAAAAKGLKAGATALAKKAAVKTMGMGSRGVLKTIAKKGVGAGMDKAAGTAIKSGLKSAAKNPVNTALAGSMVMPQGGAPKPEAAQRGVTSGKRTAGMQRMDLDLFDVVKGQLLDEGLTEEEVFDVMTTLTIDEIKEGLMPTTLKGALVRGAVGAAGGALAKKGLDKAKETVDGAINKARFGK